MSTNDVLNKCILAARFPNFLSCLSLLYQRFENQSINFVETGTIRQKYDSGDGWSTVVWMVYAQACNGRVWTCDINSDHVEICREITGNNPCIKYIIQDSIEFLTNFTEKIHLLYLDSYDTGGSEENTRNACLHQLKEAKAAIDKLDNKALIMLDDIPFNYKGGKGKLSIPYFQEQGFKILYYNEPQMILGKDYE